MRGISMADVVHVPSRRVTGVRTVAMLMVAGILYGIGWCAGKAWLTMLLVAHATAWSVTAVRVGWSDARRTQSLGSAR